MMYFIYIIIETGNFEEILVILSNDVILFTNQSRHITIEIYSWYRDTVGFGFREKG